jgi:HEAT repeat protein
MSQDTISILINQMHNARRLFGADWRLRSESASRLGELRTPQAVPDLAVVVFENKNFDLSLSAIRALGQIGGNEATEVLEKILNQTPHLQLKRAALAAILICGGAKAARPVLRHWALLTPTQHDAALWILQCLEPSQIPALLPDLQANPDPAVRQIAGRLGTSPSSLLPPVGGEKR